LNGKLIAQNASKIEEIQRRVDDSLKKNEANYELYRSNRARIEVNAAAISERRLDIIQNRKIIQENAEKIAQLIKSC